MFHNCKLGCSEKMLVTLLLSTRKMGSSQLRKKKHGMLKPIIHARRFAPFYISGRSILCQMQMQMHANGLSV
jgi:hypothetical protein